MTIGAPSRGFEVSAGLRGVLVTPRAIRRAAEGATYGDVAAELGGAVYAVKHMCKALGVDLKEGMHPAEYDGKQNERE